MTPRQLARKAVYIDARAGLDPVAGVVAASALSAVESAAECRLSYLAAAEVPGPASALRDSLAGRNTWRPAAVGVRLLAPQHAQLGAEYLEAEPLGEVDGDPSTVRWFWHGSLQGSVGAVDPFSGCWVEGHDFLGIGNEIEDPC